MAKAKVLSKERLASIAVMVAVVGTVSYTLQPEADAQISLEVPREMARASDLSKPLYGAPGLPADMVLPPLKVPPARKARYAPPPPPAEPIAVASMPDCAPALTVTAAAGAIAEVSFSAPCNAGAAIELRHAGLHITGIADAEGRYTAALPALQKTATISIAMDDRIVASDMVTLADFDRFERVALQWQGDSGLEIHAFELGAGHGAPGHVWAQSPGELDDVLQSAGGFLTRLGGGAAETDTHAEIYSFPVLGQPRAGTVRLSVEAAVTARTCGRRIEGQSFQASGPGGLRRTDLTLEMPDCDAVGEILVLKNLLRDMKIASK